MNSAADALERHRAAIRARLRDADMARANADTVAWRINREMIVIAGWGRAILLQIAHPLIAAAVAEHSSFRGSRFANVKRLASTIRAMLALTFGSDDEAIDVAAHINGIHDRVNGRLGDAAGTHVAGQQYSAHDAELLRWVHATLLDSLPLIYALLVAPLTTEEKDRYCAESAIIEPLLDVPRGLLPRDSRQLDAYASEMLASRQVAVNDTARTLAQAILFPPHWRWLWPIFRPVQLITIGLLPPSIREGYGFTWTTRDERALARWVRALRRLRRGLPRLAREWPAARRRLIPTMQAPLPRR
jgi:uncharacterized protein (DUF2236 family)